MNKRYSLLFALLLAFTALHAQNSDHPFKFGFGTNLVDYNAEAESYFKDLFDTADIETGWVVSRYTFGGTLNKSFSLGAALAINSISVNPRTGASGSALFLDGELNLNYQLANGYILKETSCFAPYIFGAVGGNYLENDEPDAVTFFPEGKLGIGADLWVTPLFGFNFQTAYVRQFSDKGIDYAHHSIGMVIRFGKGADNDNDGIPNWEDNCPDKAGIPLFQGCPDTDNDGITDALDACPTDAGLALFNGCPDSDSDGLADKDDSCPTEKGLVAFNGCPDTDADGIADKDDRCPQDKGAAEFKGCPDSDGDGIADLDDACKNEKGLAKFGGCPDSDGDGIADKDDRCPKERGEVALKGCPDSDGDGVANLDDRCPDKPGLKVNGGCPVIDETEKKKIIEKINYAAKSIQFETGSDVIKPSSYATLDNIVSIMTLYPSTSWSIEGHTDDQGEDKMNQELSDKRAAAVRKYFVSKGIAESRLTSIGYGETKPIADNKTSAGRAQNRRVEIKLVEQQ